MFISDAKYYIIIFNHCICISSKRSLEGTFLAHLRQFFITLKLSGCHI